MFGIGRHEVCVHVSREYLLRSRVIVCWYTNNLGIGSPTSNNSSCDCLHALVCVFVWETSINLKQILV
jgi:hypothetical protein